jgi:hypothetical protein
LGVRQGLKLNTAKSQLCYEIFNRSLDLNVFFLTFSKYRLAVKIKGHVTRMGEERKLYKVGRLSVGCRVDLVGSV